MTFGTQAGADDPADLQKLKDTGNCVSCDLSGAYLNAANLIDADLKFADLSNANLSDADLGGANLKGA